MEVLLLGSESESRSGKTFAHWEAHTHTKGQDTHRRHVPVNCFFQRAQRGQAGLKMSESDARLTSKWFHGEYMENTCTFRAQGG